jgi:hypothetical protein
MSSTFAPQVLNQVVEDDRQHPGRVLGQCHRREDQSGAVVVHAIFAGGLLRLCARTARLTNSGQNPDAEIVSILARIAQRFRQKSCSASKRITCLKKHAKIMPHN